MRRSVSATARRFASSSATTVRACCSCTRSQSVNGRPSVASSTASPGAWTPTSRTIASASGTSSPARGEHAAVVRQHADPAVDGRGRHRGDRVQPGLLEHQPDQPVVQLDGAGQLRVLLVDDPRHRRLGDRHERRLVRHGEHAGTRAGRPSARPPAAARAGGCRPRTRARRARRPPAARRSRRRRDRTRARSSAAPRRRAGTAAGRRSRSRPPSGSRRRRRRLPLPARARGPSSATSSPTR